MYWLWTKGFIYCLCFILHEGYVSDSAIDFCWKRLHHLIMNLNKGLQGFPEQRKRAWKLTHQLWHGFLSSDVFLYQIIILHFRRMKESNLPKNTRGKKNQKYWWAAVISVSPRNYKYHMYLRNILFRKL